MSEAWYESDDVLMQELGSALRSTPDSDRTAMLMAGYDLVTADFVETELLFDSLTASGAPVRSGNATDPVALQPRTMTFGSSGVEIEIDLDNGSLIGHVDPPQKSKVFLDQLTGGASAVPDDLGAFEFAIPSASFRIRLEVDDGQTYVTPWILADSEVPE